MNALETERSSQLFSSAGSYRLNKPWLSGFEPRLRELKTYSTMGLDQRNVDALFVVGNEPDALEGLLGSYDPQFTGSKLQACEECVQPTTVDYAGYDFYSWGEDKVANLNLKLAPPVFDNFGRGNRVTVLPGQILLSNTPAGIHSLLDAKADNIPSLWDSSDVRRFMK